MNIKPIIIKLFFLINILLFSSLFVSCEKESYFQKCKVNSDCESEYACYKKECHPDICMGEDENFCGKGICITGSDMTLTEEYHPDDSYECKCDENAILYQRKCVPTCSGFSQECIDFDNSFTGNGAYDDCNIELGHCDASCQGEGSCEEGYYCDQGHCEVYQN